MPPDTRLAKGARAKTMRSRVTFKFSATEPGSRFECKLDKQEWKACASPRTVKNLDEGKHRLRVRAIDPAGNVDPTPAQDKFRVV